MFWMKPFNEVKHKRYHKLKSWLEANKHKDPEILLEHKKSGDLIPFDRVSYIKYVLGDYALGGYEKDLEVFLLKGDPVTPRFPEERVDGYGMEEWILEIASPYYSKEELYCLSVGTPLVNNYKGTLDLRKIGYLKPPQEIYAKDRHGRLFKKGFTLMDVICKGRVMGNLPRSYYIEERPDRFRLMKYKDLLEIEKLIVDKGVPNDRQ